MDGPRDQRAYGRLSSAGATARPCRCRSCSPLPGCGGRRGCRARGITAELIIPTRLPNKWPPTGNEQGAIAIWPLGDGHERECPWADWKIACRPERFHDVAGVAVDNLEYARLIVVVVASGPPCPHLPGARPWAFGFQSGALDLSAATVSLPSVRLQGHVHRTNIVVSCIC